MSDQPTPEQETIAGYVLGWHEGQLEGRIQYQYDHRPTTLGDNHVMALLDREGFFATAAPLLDAGCGPSPHVGEHLRQRLTNRDLYFVDVNHSFLSLHRRLSNKFGQVEHNARNVREYWLLGDVQQEPYLLTGKAVLIHSTLPRRCEGERILQPDTHETMTSTLAGLLTARPERLALYLFSDDPRYPERPAMVLPALDHLGVQYRVHENVASADFQPQPGGYLVLVTP